MVVMVAWKVIDEFPGYEISQDAQVRDKYNQRILSARGGYVTLQKGKTRYVRSVNRLFVLTYPDGQ